MDDEGIEPDFDAEDDVVPESAALARRELAWEATACLFAEDRGGRFVLGCLNVNGFEETFRDEEAFFEALTACKGLVWWFGAAKYEFRWLLDLCLKRGWRPRARTRYQGGQFTFLHAGQTDHRDAQSLWASPLEEFSPDVVPPIGLRCTCKMKCGGFCAISADLTPRQFAKLERHALATCRAIWSGLERLGECQAKLDLDGLNSIGATAWSTAQRWLDLPNVEPSRSTNAYNREAAHPARVEVLRPHAARGWDFDLSMAYNGALARLDLPVGQATRIKGRDASKALADGIQGVYCAEVYSPEVFLPVLPFRSPKRKIAFPTGTFRGTWTRDELQYAVSRGYVIDRMLSAQIYRKTAPLLKPWAESLWQARIAYEKTGNSLAGYIKSLAVALPGVFGSRPMTETLLFSPPASAHRECPCEGYGTTDCPCRGWCCGSEGCMGLCGELKPVAMNRDIWIRRSYRLLGRAHVVWQALVLGWCRVEVHRFATQDGRDGSDLISINTDGLRCKELRRVPTEKGHGIWRLKGEVVDLVTTHGNRSVARWADTGDLIVRNAGVPRSVAGRRILDDEEIAARILGTSAIDVRKQAEVSVWRPIGLRAGLSSGRTFAAAPEGMPQLPRRRDRRGRLWIGPRLLDDGAVVTRAPTVEECAGL